MTDDEKIKVARIAEISYAAARAYSWVMLGEHIYAWEDAPKESKVSILNGVRYYIEHPDATPEFIHDKWRAMKAHDGWTYGETEDKEKKEHPAMVDWDDLDDKWRGKDIIFYTVADALTRLLDKPS